MSNGLLPHIDRFPRGGGRRPRAAGRTYAVSEGH